MACLHPDGETSLAALLGEHFQQRTGGGVHFLKRMNGMNADEDKMAVLAVRINK